MVIVVAVEALLNDPVPLLVQVKAVALPLIEPVTVTEEPAQIVVSFPAFAGINELKIK